MRPTVLVLGVLGALSACKPGAPTVDPGAVPGLDPSEHLLLTPTSNGENLLGRAVIFDENGSAVIADARAPGCQVEVAEELADWRRSYSEDIARIGALNAGYQQIGSLQARYGKRMRVDARVHNQKVLRADLRGPCGDVVVTSVKVGTGTRELLYDREVSGNASANVQGAPVGLEAGRWEKVDAGLSWDTAQAWAFTVGETQGAGTLGLEAVMPTHLTDGDEYTLQITAQRQVWLIVLYEEADGRAGVLLPSMQHPMSVAPANEPLTLPRLQVGLRDPATQARERIIVYAFTERGDYDLLKPPAGELTEAEATAYTKSLPDKLASIPRKRWVSTTVSYVIEPKPADADPATDSG